MNRSLFVLLLIGLLSYSAWAENATTRPDKQPAASGSPYPYLKPEDRPAKAKEALDPATGEKARFYAVWGLAISGYCPEGANALVTIASDPEQEATTRSYAGMGLRNFWQAMPQETRQTVRTRLRGAFKEEKDKLPDGVLRAMLLYGDADYLLEMIGDKLAGHPMEIEVLELISSKQHAVARLLEIRDQAPAVTTNAGWNARWRAGAALIRRQDKRGIDILIECLTVKEPWPMDSGSPAAKESNAASFRQSLANTYMWIALTIDEDFGYGASPSTPLLPEAIDRMVAWWKANRETFSFEEATSNVVPTTQPDKPLTRRQARVLAAKLATEEFARHDFRHPNRQPVGRIEIKPEYWNDVRQKDGRWILTMTRSAGPESFVSFNLDGGDPKVVVNYAWD